MRKKYVLVTGSSGTLGTRVCEFLLKKNEPLVCLDDKPNFYSSHVNKHTLKIDLRNGTFLNKESIKEKPIDTIIHLAANARVPHSIKNPIQAKDNFDILYNVLELARAEKVKKFIFIS